VTCGDDCAVKFQGENILRVSQELMFKRLLIIVRLHMFIQGAAPASLLQLLLLSQATVKDDSCKTITHSPSRAFEIEHDIPNRNLPGFFRKNVGDLAKLGLDEKLKNKLKFNAWYGMRTCWRTRDFSKAGKASREMLERLILIMKSDQTREKVPGIGQGGQ
jgi:hypothetical protein